MMSIIRKDNTNYGLGLFDDWFRDFFPMSVTRESKFWMRTDIREEDNQYVLDMDVPGFRKEDIKISIENGYLTVEATQEQSTEDQEKEGNYLRRERVYGQCTRSFYVGENLRMENIKANYNNGTLNIQIPKKREEEAKKYITIE